MENEKLSTLRLVGEIGSQVSDKSVQDLAVSVLAGIVRCIIVPFNW